MLERFLMKVEVAETGCWEWTAARRYGYGAFRVGNKMEQAHRVAYRFWVGVIPAGCEIDHLCRNQGCVNPAHLEAVTHQENMRRGESPVARQAKKTHCPQGHPYSGTNLVLDGGHRKCRICSNERTRLRDARRKASSKVAG